MAKIAYQALVADFQAYLAANDGYIPDTSGETWTQEKQDKLAATNETVRKYGSQWIGHKVEDCSGAFVRAYRQRGLSIYHGSNRIAREYVVELLPVSEAKPGMAAFKVRKPGDQLYDLKAEYKPGGSHYNGDLNDYYHIGLVDEDPRYVINAQSTAKGVKRSELADGWSCVARLKSVDYNNGGSDTDMGYLYEAVVDSANDKPVNLRKQASINAARVAEIPDGTVAKVLNEVDDDWAEVLANGKMGYMMRKFLVKIDGSEPTEPIPQQPDADRDERLALALQQIIEIAQTALYGGAKG